MSEDRFTSTEHDAARFEARFGQDTYDDDRPTLAELQRDEYDGEGAHPSGEYCIEWVGVDLTPDGPDKLWACVECGRTQRQGDMP